MKSICISAVSSNEGKTLLTTALLYHFKKSVRAYKIGPDYIDPQFHEAICNKASINLDTFIMNENQVNWIFNKYNDQDISVLEGVMGFYDGMDKGSSAYDVTKLLNVPTILLLDGSGSYITVSAVLKGLKTYKNDNTIKAVVLNKLSSSMHYELIKNQIEKDFDDITVLGWIKNDLPSLKETHLGLDLIDANKELLEDISKEILEHIDLDALQTASRFKPNETLSYPFDSFIKQNKKISIIKDKNFSFLYYDNIKFLEELFNEVEFINPTKDETISKDSHLVYIPGGYVETTRAYENIKNSLNFKNSLIEHAKSKHIYAECAGLLYLGKKVDEKQMSNILDVEFTLTPKRTRLGYYYCSSGLKGHAFHYTKPLDTKNAVNILSKSKDGKAEGASWSKNKVYGTYLHTMFRNNINILKDYFGI
ncbi:cobyrinate a,c-diamide synthase [Poseidonibacter sp.]|uniref:cobyrinate a,c-diamide synthase n=1 Tax=Poseidonibacter sp. TaxID=2321188 RepID=UPI003C769F23